MTELRQQGSARRPQPAKEPAGFPQRCWYQTSNTIWIDSDEKSMWASCERTRRDFVRRRNLLEVLK